MDTLSTEQEQIESIKKWFRENGKSIVGGLVIGIAALFGSKTWIDHNQTLASQASTSYATLAEALAKGDNDKVSAMGETIIKTYDSTPYAVMSAFAVAKVKVAAGETSAASAKLQWVLDHSIHPEFKHIARIRLARVLLSEGSAQKSLDLLKSEHAGKFVAEYEEVKGDAYTLLNMPEKARASYAKASEGLTAGSSNQYLQMKLDDLSN